MLDTTRREFIALIGGGSLLLAVKVKRARGQQPAMPVIGLIDAASAPERTDFVTAFRRGLADAGYVEGQNVAIEYRWAEGRFDRLPELAADLVRRRVSVIATPGTTAAALAAKAVTATIPIVFGVGDDPVKLGLVTNLNRPGGNATGVYFFTNELTAKRMQLLRELVPGAKRVALLTNPTDPVNESTLRDLEAAVIGQQILAFEAATGHEIDSAFESLVREKVDALFVAGGAFFSARRVQVAVLAARYAVPATYSQRIFVQAGGLMSYGSPLADTFRQVGLYAARILKGAQPVDLPVMQSTKFELVINLNTARALRFKVPPSLLALADEVIE
jgi:putative tryptophan/tyrosine transport system substrate-binding protein